MYHNDFFLALLHTDKDIIMYNVYICIYIYVDICNIYPQNPFQNPSELTIDTLVESR